MASPHIHEGVTLDSATNQCHEILKDLADSKFVIFKKACPSDQERMDFMLALGEVAGWKVDFDKKGVVQFRYEEDHHLPVWGAEKEGNNSESDVIVAWHIEHPHCKYAQIAALWCMDKKTCHKSAGSTGFVDTSKLFEMLDVDAQDFLSRCEVASTAFFSFRENYEMDIFASLQNDGDRKFVTLLYPDRSTIIPSYLRPPIGKHPQTGQNILRINPKGSYHDGRFIGHDRLATVDGRRPTQEESDTFDKIAEFAFKQITSNKDLAYFHNWDQGDAILVDIFTMAHCVRGGFNVGERYLKGIWAFPDVVDLPREPMQENTFPLYQAKRA